MTFNDKVVLVTGASRGLGKAIAYAFAGLGANVIVHYASNEAAADLVIENLPGGLHTKAQADIGKSTDTERLVKEVVQIYGRIDILVNNAGIFEMHKVPFTDFEEWKKAWDRTIAVNLSGVAYLCHHVSQQMIRQGGGRIINITSRGAFRGEPDHPAYGASKSGLNSLSQSLAQALAPHNIFVYAIAPGWIDTDMAVPGLNSTRKEEILRQSPLHRIAQPEEIANAVIWLTSEGMEYATGTIFDMNGASYLRN
ncbi:MAG: SDR family NAD(P)-dependent oxidoreductase [Bacteroidales bacterium]